MIERKNIEGILIAKHDGAFFAYVPWDKRDIALTILELNYPGVYNIQKVSEDDLKISSYVGLGNSSGVLLECVRKRRDGKDGENTISWDKAFIISCGNLSGKANNYLEHEWYNRVEKNLSYRLVNKMVPLKGHTPKGIYKATLDKILNDAELIFYTMITDPDSFGEVQKLELVGKDFVICKDVKDDTLVATGKFITADSVILYKGSKITNYVTEKFKNRAPQIIKIRDGLKLDKSVSYSILLEDTCPMTFSSASSIVMGNYITRKSDAIKIKIWDD